MYIVKFSYGRLYTATNKGGAIQVTKLQQLPTKSGSMHVNKEHSQVRRY